MRKKYYQPFIFLILLVLVIISQLNHSFSVVPGWHTIIYPPGYIIEMSLIFISLFFATIGYIVLAKKISSLNFKIFLVHFLLTLPLILGLLYPLKPINIFSLANHEMENIIVLRTLIERIIISVFLIGQIFFVINFIKALKMKTS